MEHNGKFSCRRVYEAKWSQEHQKVFVTKKQGKLLNSFGYRFQNQHCLRPEEALFLINTHQMNLTFANLPISIQKAFELLLSKDDNSVSHFTVFSELTKFGYRIARHSVTNLKQSKSSKISYNVHGSVFDWFPNCYRQSVVILPAPPLRLLPPGISLTKKSYKFHIERSSSEKGPCGKRHQSNRHSGAIKVKKLSSKSDTSQELPSDQHLAVSNFCESLSGGNTNPIINPRNAISTAYILNRLQTYGPKSSKLSVPESKQSLSIAYDLRKPNPSQSTSSNIPDYRICVTDIQHPLNLEAIGNACREEAIIMAVCSPSSVSFFSFKEIDLSTDVTMG